MRYYEIGVKTLVAALISVCPYSPANAAQVDTPPALFAPSVANATPAALAPGTIVPFQKNITITIADGSSYGSENSNLSGTQTVTAPAGGKLVIQTVSIFRSGAISAPFQAFINVSFAGQYSGFALPLIAGSTANFSGATLTGPFYAYPTTAILVNVFRSSSTGQETDTAVVSGYLIAN